MDWKPVLLVAVYLVGYGSGYYNAQDEFEREVDAAITYGPAEIINRDLIRSESREPVVCEFDEPITVVVGIMHYYYDYEELNLDWLTYTGETYEVWGWSDCEWYPEKNYAACDIYTVHPKFVDDDREMGILGHEFYHGSCGFYHE